MSLLESLLNFLDGALDNLVDLVFDVCWEIVIGDFDLGFFVLWFEEFDKDVIIAFLGVAGFFALK